MQPRLVLAASAKTGAVKPNRIRCWLFLMAAACTGADATQLPYLGGAVVTNAKVFMVNWSNDVSTQVQTGMPTFYADIVHSDYWSILQQYSTANQQIGVGTYVGSTTLFATTCGAGSCTLAENEIISEIGSRINSNDPSFPALTTDGAGNLNTVFMVHFGPHDTITVATYSSCRDFGATYDNFQANASHANLIVPIAIIPDCGAAAPETVTSSGMLADIAVDPQYFFNPAWTDPLGRSVAELCAEIPPATVVANGNPYAVSTLWSNSSNACISAERIFASGFEVP